MGSCAVTMPPNAEDGPDLSPILNIGTGLSHDNMNNDVRPQDDFNEYANGGWFASPSSEIPGEYSQWGIFQQLHEKVQRDLQGLVDEAAANAPDADLGSNAQKVCDFWKSAMDEKAIEASGAAPITALFDEVDTVKTVRDFVKLAGRWHSLGIGMLCGFSEEADLKDSDSIICWLCEGGIHLPDRDYYVDEDKAQKRDKYAEHITQMFTM